MDTMDAVWLVLAVLAVFSIVGGLMASLLRPKPDRPLTRYRQIGTAWLMGAQFEKMFDVRTPGTTTPAVTHVEL